MKIFFSDFFNVPPEVIEEYGALNISLLSDLPLFIDPFLLFNSEKVKYQELHQGILKYLRFLRDKSASGNVSPGLISAWYKFHEVSQNYLGFCGTGNKGSGNGPSFANTLHNNLNSIFSNFGKEDITHSSHLEKLCLLGVRVGRDKISDFTVNLIKDFLLQYTEGFVKAHVDSSLLGNFAVQKARFNYETESWEPRNYQLPKFDGDFILLTPKDLLTKDDTWISKAGLFREFDEIPDAMEDGVLRAQVNNYFLSILPRDYKEKERNGAILKVIEKYPQVIDYFIRHQEDCGDEAEERSILKVQESQELYIRQFGELAGLLKQSTGFYDSLGNTYEDAIRRVHFLKDVIENHDGYRLFYVKGKPVRKEEDLQIAYRLTWFASDSSVDREVNNGRGPVDFKISRGHKDSTLVEFKLAANSKLKKNLVNQVEIYKKANNTKRCIKVIMFFSDSEYKKVRRILEELQLSEAQDVILIDAGRDNKISASLA